MYDDLEDEDLLDLDEYVEYDDIEDNLGESARYLRQSAGPNTHYVQVTPMEVHIIYTSFKRHRWPLSKNAHNFQNIFWNSVALLF